MERVWDTISSRIDRFFNMRLMSRYVRAAEFVKRRVDEYLRENNIWFISELVDDSEYDNWLKVSVNVVVDLDSYDAVFKLWDKLCEVGYKGICKRDFHGVMIHVEPNYAHGLQ